MFRCDHCHTEYGGIRGLAAGTCPRCKGEKVTPPRAAETTAPDPAAFRVSRLTRADWALPTLPLVGEIAQLDRAIRL